MDTSRVDGVKAPLHDGTPRSHEAKRHVKSASPNANSAGECRDGVVEREEGQVSRFLTAWHHDDGRQLAQGLGRCLTIILIAHSDPYDRSHVP